MSSFSRRYSSVNWNDSNDYNYNVSVEESYPASLPPSLPPSLKEDLEAKISNLETQINKIRIGAKKEIKELRDQIAENKAEANKTINKLRIKILATLSPQDQKQMLGEELFPLIKKINEGHAMRVTGMMLEKDNMKILQMLEDVGYLTKEVNKALQLLKTKEVTKALHQVKVKF